MQWFSPYGKKVEGFTLIQDLSEWLRGFSNTTAGKKHQTNVLYCKLATLEPKSVELQKLQLVLNGIILALLPARLSILNSFSFFLKYCFKYYSLTTILWHHDILTSLLC